MTASAKQRWSPDELAPDDEQMHGDDATDRTEKPDGAQAESEDQQSASADVDHERALAVRILDQAVSDLGGIHRQGQQQMTEVIVDAFATGTHALIQAGTGTGKSLGYLSAALARTITHGERVVVATATLALQSQLANKDIPAAVRAAKSVSGRTASAAVLKGRTNHACLYRVREGSTAGQDALLGGSELAVVAQEAAGTAGASSAVGAEVVMLREWAEEQADQGLLGDRDDAPPHTPAAWAQVSIPVRECLGVQRCPFGSECLVEASRERARRADVVITNHALLAIDAMHGGTALPEHEALVIDEAHELVSRVTGAASVELSGAIVERVAQRALPWLDDTTGLDLLEAGEDLESALTKVEPGRITQADATVAACTRIRTAARKALTVIGKPGGGTVQGDDAERQQCSAAVKEVFDIAERVAALNPADVVWTSDRERGGRWVHVAPLNVAGLMREAIFSQRPTVLTSATLKIGGEFEQVAGSFGLPRSARRAEPSAEEGDPFAWQGVDVGSPFDYPRQGILYVAKDLPNPSREGIGPETLAEVAELVWAADGRALGLFASQRNAEAAARHVRSQLAGRTVLCQGDAQLSELTRRFIAEEQTCLFGTLSLWQGIDVPGDSCRLVIMDKIPFPRPDDPLLQARQDAVKQAGGNGFMSVAATHAGLLLAQGAGRLIRRATDKGVVAVLDPRLVTARYGSFLRASIPPFWMTTDREVAIQALQRLGE